MVQWKFEIIESVKNFIQSLSATDIAKIRTVFRLFEEYGPLLPAKYIKKMSGTKDIWELRAKRIRIFFFIHKNSGIGVHGIIKRSQKTPKQDIEVAMNRMRSLQEGLI